MVDVAQGARLVLPQEGRRLRMVQMDLHVAMQTGLPIRYASSGYRTKHARLFFSCIGKPTLQ